MKLFDELRPRRKSARKPRARYAPPVDQHAKRELELYLENTGALYIPKMNVVASVAKKMRAGKYKASLAPKLWLYWVDRGARLYCKEFCARGDKVSSVFSAALRRELAGEIAAHEAGRIRRGEYGALT